MALVRIVKCFVLICLLGFMLPAWADDAAPAVTQNSCSPVLVKAATAFGFSILPRLWQSNAQGNTLISNASLHLALTMTYNGAKGATREAMAGVLGLVGKDEQRVDIHYLALHQSLIGADPSVTLKVANGLWCRQAVKFHEEFLDANQMYFNAKIAALDFSKPDSLKTINSWIASRTEGKIPSIIDRIDPAADMYLTNALYFQARWSAPFDVGGTEKRDFTTLSGTKVQVPMMQRNASYKYLSANGVQGIRLPYGSKEKFSMYVLAPAGGTAFPAFLQSMTQQSWQSYLSQFKPGVGWVRLPRFGIKYGGDMKATLSAMGMAIAFDKKKADFSAMSPTPLEISRVLHKTYMKVDEQGTEAAAATAVEMRELALAPGNDFDITFDHPFLCLIQDDETGTVLFMGAVVDPSVGV